MRYMILAALLAISFTASAGNDSCNNRCGDDTGGTINNGGNGGAGYGGDGTGIGVGVGVGLGGNASANAVGQGGAGGGGGAGGHGGAGGIGIGTGGDAAVVGSGNSANLNKNDATSISGSDASSHNDNRSQGNTTSVNYRTERNAPPVYLGAIAPTVSCAGGVNAGASSQGGSGAFGFTWISADCKQTVAGQNMAAIGETRMACEIFRQTDGFKRAARRNPALNEISCR